MYKNLGKAREVLVLMDMFWDVDTNDIDKKCCKHEHLVYMMSLIRMHIDTVRHVIGGYILRNNAILCVYGTVPNL